MPLAAAMMVQQCCSQRAEPVLPGRQEVRSGAESTGRSEARASDGVRHAHTGAAMAATLDSDEPLRSGHSPGTALRPSRSLKGG